MLGFVLGVWPGVAAVIMGILAAVATIRRPKQEHHIYWLIAFAVLGSTAIAATIGSQVIIFTQARQREREDQARERRYQNDEDARNEKLSHLQGAMDTLLTLIPGLKSGRLDLAIEAQRQLSGIQSQLSLMTTHRHLTVEQLQVLDEFPPRTQPCEGYCSTLTFTSTTETERYALEFLPIMSKTGWNPVSSPFLNEEKRFTDEQHKIAIIVNPVDLPRFESFNKKLINVGINSLVVGDGQIAAGGIEVQVDDVY